MVGAYYNVIEYCNTSPIIIAMTALCRLIILHSKDADPGAIAEAIVVLAGAYIMSAKEKLSPEKKKCNNESRN